MLTSLWKNTSRANRQIGLSMQVSAVMQEIVVTVLKGDSVVETFCFPDAPMQAAEIEHALEKAGHKGLLQNAKYTYTSKHLLQHGAYTLKVSEAAAGKSSRGHHVWSGLPLPERLSPGPQGSLRPLLRSADAVVCLPSLMVCSECKHSQMPGCMSQLRPQGYCSSPSHLKLRRMLDLLGLSASAGLKAMGCLLFG